MKRLIFLGDPGIRNGAVIDYDGQELICFSVTRNGEWHGPDEGQLWCVVGTEDERETFETRSFVPHFLETERLDADEVTVRKARGDPAR